MLTDPTCLSDAGYTLASLRRNSTEAMVEYGVPAKRAVCTADAPSETRYCMRAVRGADGWCENMRGDICMPATDVANARSDQC
jgi:hypothetical protein